MKLLQILAIFLLIIPISIAQDDLEPISAVNIDTSVDWIMKQTPSVALDAALATLAATKSDLVSNRDAVNNLLNLKHQRFDCWPSTSCNVKDTSMAILALAKTGNAISTSWLKQQERSNTEGSWYLQIDTEASGECKISYNTKQKTILVERGRIKSNLCPYSVQFDLTTCLEKNLLANKESLDITISCGPLGTGKISLVYKIDEKYFIVGEVTTNVFVTFSIKNTDFGNYESTLYASWLFKKINKDVNSIIWLRRFYQPSIESSSLMYLITEDDYYIDDLLVLQDENTGSFGNVYETALATLALRTQGTRTTEIDMAKTWLESKMLSDGSWNKDVKDTAMAIYGAFAQLDLDIIPTTTLPDYEEPKGCNENGLCEVFLGETSVNCPSDCSCGDGICDDSESDITCLEDCEAEPYEPYEYEEEEGRGFLFYFIIILIILGIIGGLAYFYYKKFYLTGKTLFKFKFPFKKTKALPLLKQPEKKPVYKRQAYPSMLQRKPRKTLAEKQLEKSLEESKKLFRKK